MIDGIYKILLSEIGQTFVSNCLVRSFDSQHFVLSTAAWFNIDTVFKDSHTTETVAVMTRPVMTALDGIINYDLRICKSSLRHVVTCWTVGRLHSCNNGITSC